MTAIASSKLSKKTLRCLVRGLSLATLSLATLSLATIAGLVWVKLERPAHAQSHNSAPTLNPTPAEIEAKRLIEAREAEKKAHEAELQRLRETAKAAIDTKAKFEGEATLLKADRARLNTALIDTTTRIRAIEERAAAAETRLRTLAGSEEAIRRSLTARRGIISDVLASLQRLGRRPPPAVLVRPEDILQSVRAAILLGAVVPELRFEAEALAEDLTELTRLREATRSQREELATELGTLAGESERLARLIAARQEHIAETEKTASRAEERATQLGEQAQSLRELIDKIDKDISIASRSAELARKELEAQTREVREKFAAAAFKDPARMAPKISFNDARGLLPQPVSGSLIKGFGQADGYGGTIRGILIGTRASALVSAPVDAWVSYAGQFRSYGRVLILNAGGGYHILLSGMERVDVTVGQFILAGEPVGTMGESAAAGSTVLGGDTSRPMLYVEFRKDGVSVDPAPWWSQPPAGKSSGDTSQEKKARG